jgi:16S rRNA (cytosine967-C5)-methyltransferase
MNVRAIIYRSLLGIEKEKKYSSAVIENTLNKTEFSDVDKRFFIQAILGIIEKKITIDFIIGKFSKIKVNKLDLSTLILLRMGTYEIIYLDKVPQSATVNETVSLASDYSSRSKNYINAVLRNICNNIDSITDYSKIAENNIRLSVEYSYDLSIVDSLIKDYGSLKTESILKSMNIHKPTTVRVNTNKISLTEFSLLYPSAENCHYSPFGFRIFDSAQLISALKKGHCFVQDESSQIAGIILDPKENDFIIDVCGAPGGKSFNASLISGCKSKIITFDIHEQKVKQIKSQSDHLGFKNIDSIVHNSETPVNEYLEKADKVICDVPCSGIGVIEKKPDIRNHNINTNSLPELQFTILSQSSKYLKPGGTLIYSTCTLKKAENDEVVKRFLDNNPNFYPDSFSCKDIISNNESITLFPDDYGFDGFFISKIKRK